VCYSLCECLFDADKATLQNVKNTTRLLFNPDVPEVVAFRERYKSCFVLFFSCVFNYDISILLCNYLIWVVD